MPDVDKRKQFLLAVLVTHLLFSAYYLLRIEADRWYSWFLPSFEVALAALLIISGEKKGKAFSLRMWSASLLYGLLIYRLAGQLFFRFFYLQNFSIVNDSALMVGFAGMLMGEAALPGVILGIIVWAAIGFVLLLLGKLTASLVAGLRASSKEKLGPLPIAIILLSALGINLLVPAAGPGGSIIADLQAQRELRRMMAGPSSRDPILQGGAAADESADQAEDFAFPIIGDEDVHFFVIESYGMTLFMREEYIQAMRATYGELEPRLRARGWDIYTGMVRSPAFGGRSWLADSSLLTGTFQANQAIFEAEISDGLPADMLTFMGSAGYHRIYAAPGTNGATDEWKIAYPFEEYFERYSFGYRGPFLNLGAMSDQYFLDRVGRYHLEDERREFAMYVMVSSHVPFTIIPQYKPDWDFSRFGREYEDGFLRYFDNNWLSGNELAEGYLTGIDYSLRTIEGYIETHLNDRGFVLIIGDHQPRKPVSVPTAGYAVPFHILVRRGTTLQFPPDWLISREMTPPPLPPDESVLGTIADIPHLVQELLSTPLEAGYFTR